MSNRTLYRKLVDSHIVSTIDAENVLLYVDLHLMNEYTSPQAFAGLEAKKRSVRRSRQQLAVVSHVIPTHTETPRVIRDAASRQQVETLAHNCAKAGIRLYGTNDPQQGIEHIVAPENGFVRPGMVVLCGDSHTTTYGALGALGFGIGTSEVEHVLATQTLVYRLAKTMRIIIDGALPYGTSSKTRRDWPTDCCTTCVSMPTVHLSAIRSSMLRAIAEHRSCSAAQISVADRAASTPSGACSNTALRR
jgi:3-isopropylmalate/(R)-2-methylmalate dehydratase large subunit